jgi:hypothetical protein
MATPFDRACEKLRERQNSDVRLDPATFVPYAVHFAEKMIRYLALRHPKASEMLILAAQAQHLQPHDETPGFYDPQSFKGKDELRKIDADLAKQICLKAGYNEHDAHRVASLVRRENLQTDKEAKVLQDLEYLVLVSDQYKRLLEDKIEPDVNLLREALRKLTDKGRVLLLRIPYLEKNGPPVAML